MQKHAVKEKPSVIATMEKYDKQIQQDKKDNPVPDISKSEQNKKDAR